MRGFQSEMELEEGMETLMHVLPGNKLRNQDTDFPLVPDLQKTETCLLTSEHLPRVPPHLQANELTAWTLAGHPIFSLLAHKQSCPNPQLTF